MVIININPATLEENGRVEETSIDTMDEIVQHTKNAQREWRSLDVARRARIVAKVNEYLTDHMEEI